MSQQQPTPEPLTTDERALRALAIAGRSPVLLNAMEPEHRQQLADLVDPKGNSTAGGQHGEAVRLVLVAHHESKKASVAEDEVIASTDPTGDQLQLSPDWSEAEQEAYARFAKPKAPETPDAT